jgi:hypothetical protein
MTERIVLMTDDQKQLRVIRVHRGFTQDSVVMAAGDHLRVEEKETEWQGWVWCVGYDGGRSWVPEAYLQIEGDMGIARCSYDATELTVNIGEMLKVMKEESGWLWCENTAGKQGWVPSACVEKDEHEE